MAFFSFLYYTRDYITHTGIMSEIFRSQDAYNYTVYYNIDYTCTIFTDRASQ